MAGPQPTHPSAVSGVFGEPFAEQVAFFRRKLGNLVPTRRWDDLQGAAHDQAFMVAGAMEADLLSDLASAVDKAIAEGRGIEDFRRDFNAIVARNGWTGWTGEGSVKGEAWRVGVIYRTNSYTSYSAGRFAQLKAGNYPFWVYRHGGSLEPRPAHLSWDGVALPPDHAFWTTHYPPSDWGCSCYAVGARTAAGVRRMGGDPDKRLPDTWNARDPKTGAPVGIGKGWDYAPGASVADAVNALARKIEQWPAPIGAGFGEEFQEQIAAPWPQWVSDTRAGTRHDPALLGTLRTADVEALTKLDQAPASAEIWFNPGLIKGPKFERHRRAGDALPDDVIENLPVLMRTPRSVLYDSKTGRLIYLLAANTAGRAPQLAIAVNYWRKVERAKVQSNFVRSAYQPDIADVRRRVKAGDLIVLSGTVE